MDDFGFVLRALGFGALIGLSLGALGAGGSILTVPILVFAMGLPVQSATSTSLAIVGLNSAAGALDYLRRGLSLPRTGVAFGASGLAGAFAGVWVNHQVTGDLILLLFSVVMLGAAYSMWRRRSAGGALTFEERYDVRGWARLVSLGLGVGFLTGFFGIGGGFLIVPTLVVVLGMPLQLAIGTSLLAIALNSLWGVLGNVRVGTLDWQLTLLFAAGGVAGTLAGSKLAGRSPDRVLRGAFSALIVSIAFYTLLRSIQGLLRG